MDIHGKHEISDIAEKHSDGKEFSRTMNIRREEDYEKINSQMESLNQQKQDFMQKISSFAEKLKILWYLNYNNLIHSSLYYIDMPKEGQKEWEVEKIIQRGEQQGKTFYLVKWKGYPLKEATW